MSTPLRIAAFLVALAAVFGVAVGVGSAVGPIGPAAPAVGSDGTGGHGTAGHGTVGHGEATP